MISTNVVILTRDEFEKIKRQEFQRGVERGRFEESYERNNSGPKISGHPREAVDSHATPARLGGGLTNSENPQ